MWIVYGRTGYTMNASTPCLKRCANFGKL